MIPKPGTLQYKNQDSGVGGSGTGVVITTPDPLINALMPILKRVRTDVYWLAKSGRQPWCVKAPLKESNLLNHVRGGARCGVAPINPGTSVTSVGLLDFDSHKGETNWVDMKVVVMKVIKALQDQGVSPIPFRSSGGKGIHLYLLWDTPQDAYSVRRFLRDVLQSAGFSDGTKGVAHKKVEVFPKQDFVAEGAFGNMFILPLAGQSIPLDVINLRDISKVNVQDIRWPVSTDVPIVIPPTRLVESKPPDKEVLLKLSSALDAIPYKDADQVGYQRFLSFVFAIHHASVGSPEGLELAHSFFSRASEYDGDEIDKLWANTDARKGLQDIRTVVTAATIYHEARKHGWIEPVENDFEDLTKLKEADTQSLPSFIRNNRGEILLTMDNIVKAIGYRDHCGMDVGYDTFRDEIMYSIDDGINWVPFKDSDYSKLRINLERAGFKSTNKEATRDAVLLVAESNSFDSAQLWLNAIEWDEVNRVDSFMPTYIGTEDNPYYRAAGRYLWTALAGRVLSPGCKADMSPVLVGKQGTRKSSAVAAMSPDPMYFTEISFDEKDDDLSRKMRGCLIAEIAELRGLRTKDMEHVKAWITKQYENWVPKYREFSTTFPRRLVFIGTTNNEEFLADETGNRRWLPVRVNSVIDVDQITRDRTQLWAEAREIFKVRGVEYREAEVLAVQVHAEHMMSDPWVSIVANWLQKGDEYDYQSIKPSELPYLQTHEVLRRALNMGANRCGKWEEMRVGTVLRALGYERKKKRIGTQTLQVYVPTVPSNEYWWEHRTP